MNTDRTAMRTESDLDLHYIETEGSRLIAAMVESEEVTDKDCRWLWDTIGDLIGEVQRLLLLIP